MSRMLALALTALLTAGCADTGQDRANVPLFVAGTDVSQPMTALLDVPVTIDRADLAFGPLYLCAGATAGDLCEVARVEWLGTVVVDLTTAAPAEAGELTGVTGPVQSWMYDLGISSQLTRSEAYILDAARELGDTSLVLEGSAVVDGIPVPFSASVPVLQTEDTELGVPVVRKSSSESFFQDIDASEAGLLVRFDVTAWVRGIDFTPSVSRDVCAVDGPDLICDGTLERTCDADTELSVRDCADDAEVCIPNQGCRSRWVIEDGSEAFRALRNALLSGQRPTFTWDAVP